MPFNINSSVASAADPHHAADGAAHAAVANPPRGGVVSIVRNLLEKYARFNLGLLSHGMHAFSAPQAGSESSLDTRAYTKLIFDQVQHRISGKQDELEATLRRMEELLNAAAAQPAAGAAPRPGPQPRPQSGPQAGAQPSCEPTPPQEAPHAAHAEPAEPAEPARPEPDRQQHARRQADQRRAEQMRRTLAEAGEANALSLLGGQAVPGSHGHFDHHNAWSDDGDADLQAELRERELYEAQLARPPSRGETDHG